MSSVDDRIVSLKFDNAAFSAKIADTIKSLDQLKKSLDFANSTRGMNELSTASKNFNMGNMSASVDGVSAKFLALATVALTALSRITNAAITAGLQFVKSFTIAPVLDGFHEFETKVGSIQTILANTSAKGTTLEQVTAALDELNTYADKTIYNFGEMTKNIGLFTNAGIGIEDATAMIKGFSNAAAASGTNSEGAASAAYQLSQALSSGTIRLMDWRSLTNVGMGNKNMQNGLIEIADAMGTLNKNGTTAKEIQSNFNASLEKNWLSADVMTKYLKIMAGEMNAAEMAQLGLTASQIASFQKQQTIAQDAATKVRTFSQLIGTIRESIGSGWAQTFDIVLGNFDEATALFTGISNAVGKVAGDFSNARNEMLQGWKDLGGRTALLEGFKNVFSALGQIIKPIKEAFRDIFPAMTAQRLVDMTKSFQSFTEHLKIGAETASKIKSVFSGLFSILDIGWEVVKGIAGVFIDLVGALLPAGEGLLNVGATAGDFITNLHEMLVTGGAIKNFFESISNAIAAPIKFLSELANKISAFLGLSFSDTGISAGLERIGARAEHITSVWQRMQERLQGVTKVLDKVWDVIADWFSSLGQKIAQAFQPGDFDAAVDVVNVGLLGGIAILFKKFLNGGLKIDFGKGLFRGITETFDQLTTTLKTMQTNLKADTLLKIAAAMGILTASLVVLSLIDSKALTKALIAISVGFGQLVGVMYLLNTVITSAGAAAKLAILGVVLIELSVAIGIFSIAIKNLSTLKLGDLAKGLIGVGVGLGILVAAVNLITIDTGGLIAAGIAMTAIAIALLILSKAVESFSGMSWSELARGLASIAVGLGLIVVAMNFMPPSSVLSGIGFIAIATGLRILAEAVQAFGNIGWGEMTKGMVGIGTGLIIIAGAMHLMPLNLPITAAGMLILSVALNVMALAIKSMGQNDIGEIAKGVGTLAAMLLILSLAMNAMSGTLGGAAALLIVSNALLVLTGVLKILGNMDISEILIGLGAMAAVFILLGGAAYLLEPLTPALMGLGLALAVVGGSFALFGTGVFLVAKGLETLAKSGVAGAKALIEMVKVFVTAKFEIARALAAVVISFAEELLKAAPLLVRLFQALLMQLLETIITVAPTIAKAIGVIITEAIKLIKEQYPAIFAAGLEILLALLRGIRDNIPQIMVVVLEIIYGIVDALVTNMSLLVNAGTTLITSFLFELGNHAQEITNAGFKVVTDFITGIANNIVNLANTVTNIIITFINTISNNSGRIVTAGTNALLNFLNGIQNNMSKVVTKGVDIIIAFIQGIGNNAVRLTNAAADTVIKFVNGIATSIRSHQTEMNTAGRNLAFAIADGMTFGLASKVKSVADAAVSLVKGGINAAKHFAGIKSPSTVFIQMGKYMADGLAIGLTKDTNATNSAISLADHVVSVFQSTFKKIPDAIRDIDNFHPVISPVLDLTKVRAEAAKLEDYVRIASISPNASFDRAKVISMASNIEQTARDTIQELKQDITFEQNNYSPTALSVTDIYRNTKSQIALAKEELGIS